MQPRNFSLVDGRFQLDDYAGAAKVVVVPGRAAQRIADLSLHMRDLLQVLEWWAALGRIAPGLDPGPGFTIRRGLWYSMVVSFCKCFGSSDGRGRLDPQAVFKGDAELLSEYRYFEDLRNKNFVHDENTMSQAFTLAVLNHPSQEPKVVDITCLSISDQGFNRKDIAKLEPLVRRTEQWVHEAFDEACARLKAELETQPYEALDALASTPDYRLHDEGDASLPKPRLNPRRTGKPKGP
jgi:hypothetical protein